MPNPFRVWLFLFQKGLPITKKSSTRYLIHTAARKSYSATDRTVGTIINAHQPFLKTQNEVTSTLISSGVDLALISYKLRRFQYRNSWCDVKRGNYYVDLAKDLIQLIWEIVWAFLEPIVFGIVSTIIYATVSLAVFGLIFYILFIM